MAKEKPRKTGGRRWRRSANKKRANNGKKGERKKRKKGRKRGISKVYEDERC